LGVCGLNSHGSGYTQVVGSYEYSNEQLGFIKEDA
jgi:hypothetical protein